MNHSIPFISRMVLRELRREWSVLFSALVPIVVGVAVMVTLSTLYSSVLLRLEQEERLLVGADLTLSLRGKPTEEFVELARKVVGESVSEVRFPSMLSLPSSGQSLLVNVQGLDGEFPFYGERETQPAGRGFAYLADKSILVEENVALQLDLAVGDQVRLGDSLFTVAAVILSSPGQSEVRSSFAPSIIVSKQDLEGAGLLLFGIRQKSLYHFKLSKDFKVSKDFVDLEREATNLNVEFITPSSRREALSETVEKVYGYLSLFAIATLLVGALGAVSGGAHYAARKQRAVATLRCIGASSVELMITYGLTFLLAAFVFSLIGALLSLPLLEIVGNTVSQFVPFELSEGILPSMKNLLWPIVIGTVVPLLFALPPILSLRKVSPLEALRAEVESAAKRRGSNLSVLLATASLMVILGASIFSQPKFLIGFGLSLFLLSVIHLLVAVGFRKFASFSWVRSLSFGLRHGIASLRRPGSEALFVSVLVGVPTFLGLTLWILQVTLNEELEGLISGNKDNIILFDVQRDQRESLEDLSAQFEIKLGKAHPLVSMRLLRINDVATSKLASREKNFRKKWYLTREYQNTYRSEIEANEVLLQGVMPKGSDPRDGTVPVTVEKRMADILGLKIGDSLLFSVQGVELLTKVVGVRKFNFRAVNPGFLVVFPMGVLEEAPQFMVITGRGDDPKTITEFKKALATAHSNVSVIDSREIRATIERIFVKLRAVILLLGGIFALAACVLIFSTVQLSSNLRFAEQKIYKVLGAAGSTLKVMSFTEFLCIGIMGVSSGTFVSILFVYFAAGAYLDLKIHIPFVPLAFVCLAITLFVALTGVLGLSLAKKH